MPACATRIYIDIEGEPERGFDYLLGMIVEADGGVEQHSFWADTPAEESRLFLQFLDVVACYDDFRVYCYGSYEGAFLRRMIKLLERQELDGRLLSCMVNVLSVIHAHVYFPTYSNGLKDIGRFLGCRWTEADASGIQSIVWRRGWEETRSVMFKDMLMTYNLEDCGALKRVTEFLYATCSHQWELRKVGEEGFEIAHVEEISHQYPRPDWGDMVFALPDFSFVNERARFDYQRDRVFVRTSKTLRRCQSREGAKRWKKNRKVNWEVDITTQPCPFCGGTEIVRYRDRRFARLSFDLRVTGSSIKRWVTRYRTSWHHCTGCGKRFLPSDYLRLEEFCHSLRSWAMYEHVAHRTSLGNITDTIRECFNMPIGRPQVHIFKQLLADYYEGTYKRLLEKIVGGPLLHVDETEVHVRRVGRGYVWVFTNLEEVVYLYRQSREGDFLHDLLKDFRGVLISDFYAAYDSLNCPQQKCLIHLIRDFNQDIVGNPWDEELKSLASDFGSLLRAVIATVDRYGLRQRHLGKHRREVDRFFQTSVAKTFRSEVAEGYRKRLLKYRDKLFTFLDHDSVPWNNNNAEHAVKAFAYYREVADNLVTEGGLTQYLVLLSLYQTCKYKRISLLKFLVSGQTDIDVFSRSQGKRVLPVIGALPRRSGVVSSEPKTAGSAAYRRERHDRRSSGSIGAVEVAAENPAPLNQPGDAMEIVLGFRDQLLQRGPCRRLAGRLAECGRLSDQALHRREVLDGGLRQFGYLLFAAELRLAYFLQFSPHRIQDIGLADDPVHLPVLLDHQPVNAHPVHHPGGAQDGVGRCQSHDRMGHHFWHESRARVPVERHDPFENVLFRHDADGVLLAHHHDTGDIPGGHAGPRPRPRWRTPPPPPPPCS